MFIAGRSARPISFIKTILFVQKLAERKNMKQLFAIKDKIAENFTYPIVSNSSAMIQRDIKEMLTKNEVNYITQNYKDKTLYLLGSFDEATGKIDLVEDGPKKLIELEQLVEE
nr:MAG: nonstructural protein [Microvirus Sku122]